MRRINLALIILLLAGLSLNVTAQKSSYKVAKAGVGVDGLRVGKSTRADVIKKYGKNFSMVKFGKYSAQMKYRNGMSFYYCQNDKTQEIFVIEMRSPAKVKTAKGIVLNKSTVSQLQKAYGKPRKGLRFKGIEFYYTTIRGKKVITVIDIVENSGMRECK